MKKIIAVLFPLILAFPISGCSNEESAERFELLGKWGMVSGSITNSDGTTDRYGELGKGNYYQTLEYKADGTYIKVAMPSGPTSYGTYTYNNSNQTMKYKLDGDRYYTNATITIHKANKITLFTDWGSVGSMTQYLVKI